MVQYRAPWHPHERWVGSWVGFFARVGKSNRVNMLEASSSDAPGHQDYPQKSGFRAPRKVGAEVRQARRFEDRNVFACELIRAPDEQIGNLAQHFIAPVGCGARVTCRSAWRRIRPRR